MDFGVFFQTSWACKPVHIKFSNIYTLTGAIQPGLRDYGTVCEPQSLSDKNNPKTPSRNGFTVCCSSPVLLRR